MSNKVYVLCHKDGSFVYNVGCLAFSYTEKQGAQRKFLEMQKRHKKNYDDAVRRNKTYGSEIPHWVIKEFDIEIKEFTKETVITDENQRLREENKVLLDRLHQCKRRNREDKVKLRNELDRAKEARDFYSGELYYQGLLAQISKEAMT